MIQVHYLRDVERDWTITDLYYKHALSVAIPYCDIAVTDEKALDTAKSRVKLGEQFGTAILSRLTDLATYLNL